MKTNKGALTAGNKINGYNSRAALAKDMLVILQRHQTTDFSLTRCLFIIISILNFNPTFFEILHICYRCLDPIPDGHEGKAKEKTKGSSELSKPGLEGINQGLLLNQGVLGNGPEAEG